MVLAQAVQQNRFRYVYHYDELTWMPEILARPFNELKVPYPIRGSFMDWVKANTTGMIYIWPGMISPFPNQSNWGRLISPDEENFFIIFENDSDQTRFSLEFVGSPDAISAVTHKDGTAAYHSRKR